MVLLWAPQVSAYTTIGSHVGALQQSMGRSGRVWAVGVTSGGSVSLGLNERWRLRFGLEWSRLWDDTSSTSLVKFANRTTETTRAWTTTSLRVMSEYHPEFLEDLGSYLSLGVGTASWEVQSYPDYEAIELSISDGRTEGYSASELLVVGGFGFEPALTSNVHARIEVQADYFTGVGLDFPDEFRDDRSHFLVGLTFGLSYSFGSIRNNGHGAGRDPLIIRPQQKTTSEESVRSEFAVESSGQVTEPASPMHEYHGPTTGELFASLVPEQRRHTPPQQQLMQLQEYEPPITDTDGDGVLDAHDDCPATPRGYSVDASGCMKLTARSEGFVLRVKYESGTTDPDSISMLILDDLANRLLNMPNATVFIEGHTDNIGTDLDNLILSQKRATKVKDYLVEAGVPEDQINAVGRGEAEPIASNGTASGRMANRRIEISYEVPNSSSAAAE